MLPPTREGTERRGRRMPPERHFFFNRKMTLSKPSYENGSGGWALLGAVSSRSGRVPGPLPRHCC